MPRANHAALRARARPFLGTMPDSRIAEQYGIDASIVRRWRQQQAIPPYRFASRLRAGHCGIAAYLAALRRHPEGLTQAALARQLGVHRQAAHQMLHRLMRRGYVTRVTRPAQPGEPGRWHGTVTRYRLVTTQRGATS